MLKQIFEELTQDLKACGFCEVEAFWKLDNYFFSKSIQLKLPKMMIKQKLEGRLVEILSDSRLTEQVIEKLNQGVLDFWDNRTTNVVQSFVYLFRQTSVMFKRIVLKQSV